MENFLKVNPSMVHKIIENAKVSDFITFSRCSDINPLVNTLLDHIINKIKATPISISDIKYQIKMKSYVLW